MPAIQSAYTQTMRPAFAGMKADMVPETVLTRIAETAIGFGVAAFQGTGDRQCRAANGTATFVGVTVLDQGVVQLTPPVNPDQFGIGDDVPVMTKGGVWVLAGAAVVANAPAFVIPATGVFTPTGTGNTPINAKFETSAALGALTLLRLF